MRPLIALATAAMAWGCPVGTTPPRFQPAIAPAGVIVSLAVPSARFQGELLAIDDTALIVRKIQGSDPVTFVRFAAIRGSAFRQVGVALDGGHPPRAEDRERIRRVSRFPQGLTPELLRRVLDAYAQTAPALY